MIAAALRTEQISTRQKGKEKRMTPEEKAKELEQEDLENVSGGSGLANTPKAGGRVVYEGEITKKPNTPIEFPDLP